MHGGLYCRSFHCADIHCDVILMKMNHTLAPPHEKRGGGGECRDKEIESRQKNVYHKFSFLRSYRHHRRLHISA
jgi:hypothetical protein